MAKLIHTPPWLHLQNWLAPARRAPALTMIVFALTICPWRSAQAQESSPQTPAKSAATANSTADSLSLAGQVVDEQGQPVIQAEVELLGWAKEHATITTQPDGTFRVTVDKTKNFPRQLWARTADRTRQGFLTTGDEQSAVKTDRLLVITLKPAREVKISVVDGQGAPVGNAQINVISNETESLSASNTNPNGTLTLQLPVDASIAQIIAFKSGAGFDFYTTQTSPQEWKFNPLPDKVDLKLTGARTMRIHAVDSANRPVAGVPILPWIMHLNAKNGEANLSGCDIVKVTTDASGVATFDWLPNEFLQGISFLNHSAQYSSVTQPFIKPGDQQTDLTLPLLRKATLSGHVFLPDGKPAPGITVMAQGVNASVGIDDGSAVTKNDGSYEMPVDSEAAYIVAVADDHWAAPNHVGVVLREDKPVGDLNFTLAVGTLVSGIVTTGPDHHPAAQEYISLSMNGSEMPPELKKPGDRTYRQMRLSMGTQTDAEGKYQFCVGPGKFELLAQYPDRGEPVELNIDFQHELIHDFQLAEGKPKQKSLKLSGRVVNSDNQPVAGAIILGVQTGSSDHARDIEAVTAADGTFEAWRTTVPFVLSARTKDYSQAGVLRLDENQTAVTLRIGPTASVQGRLFDRLGNIMPGGNICYYVPVYDGEAGKSPFRQCFGGNVVADADGNYTLRGLFVGQEYQITYAANATDGPWSTLTKVTPTKAETIQLGDTKLSNLYHPPTLEEKTAQYFNQHDNLAERIAQAKKFAAGQFLQVMLIVGDPKSDAARKFVQSREQDVLTALQDYEQLAVPTDDAAAMDVLQQTYNLDAAQLQPLSLVILGDKGQVLATKKVSLEEARTKDEQAFAKELQAFTALHALPHPDAEKLLAEAQDRARREGKCVLLDQTGTYCGWCRILARFMDRHPAVFDANFVIVRVDDSRYQHGDDVMKRYLNKAGGGIPWCAILDANGNKLADWDGPDGKNIGYPSEPQEIDYFLKILAQTAPKITTDQIADLRTDLEQDAKKYAQH